MAAHEEQEQRGQVAAIPRPFVNWKVPPRYQIKTLLGVGSYGHVCEAYDSLTKKKVAIKKVSRAFDELIDCKRILREVALVSRLKHPNIVSSYDLVIPGDPAKFDELYLVLELADSDLKKLLKTAVHLTEQHVQLLLYNLLVGLKFVHSCGIYHRDLKPANCLVNNDCCVKICDFGLARTVEAPGDPKLLPGALSGDADEYSSVLHNRKAKRQLTSHVVTRWYRAPELILLQEDYTEAIDVWSVGCIFAELLGMMKENVRSCFDRGALIPGGSCFPLSPDEKQSDYKSKWFHSNNNNDQLNVIFNVIGYPSNEDIEALGKEDAKRYVRLFPQRSGIDFARKYPGTSAKGVKLLQRMLTFNPKKRITVREALECPYFESVRTKSLEVTASMPMRLPFDDWADMSESELRYGFLREAQKYHPDIIIPPQLAAVGYKKSTK